MRRAGYPSCIVLSALALLAGIPARAEAPDGHFEVTGDVVEDTATRLTWQRVAAEPSYDADGASAYCAALELSGKGWRLPNLKELHTIVDETRTMPAIDRTAFPDSPSAHFWTSSAVAGFQIYAWLVNFADGTDVWHPRENQHRVRCVR